MRTQKKPDLERLRTTLDTLLPRLRAALNYLVDLMEIYFNDLLDCAEHSQRAAAETQRRNDELTYENDCLRTECALLSEQNLELQYSPHPYSSDGEAVCNFRDDD